MLGHVVERDPTPVSIDELVDVVATELIDGTADAADRRRMHIGLRHDAVPALSSAGLVTVDERDGVVSLSDAQAIDDDLTALLGDHARVTDDSLDAVFDAVADHRRRLVCATLNRASHAMDVEALARAVAAREVDESPHSVSSELVERVLVSLVHVHLPHLVDAELLTYDEDSGIVSALDRPHVPLTWIDPAVFSAHERHTARTRGQ